MISKWPQKDLKKDLNDLKKDFKKDPKNYLEMT